jgi:hypothetical protein
LKKPSQHFLFYLFWCIAIVGAYTSTAQAIDTTNVIGQISKYLLYRNHDTNYISNYGDEIAVKLYSNNKFNYFRVRDRQMGSSIRYRPSRDISLGLGVAYKWFALDVGFSLGLRSNSDIENANAFDFQGRLYSSKQLVTFNLQYYSGFKLANLNGVDVELNDANSLRSDIRTINFALEYLYAFNYTRFSMKAPFVFNEIQRKSAGSPIIGATFGIFTMAADSSILPFQAQNAFRPNAQISDFSLMNTALNFGYMYTFVYKSHYFISIGLIPGINFNAGDYFDESTEQRRIIPLNAHAKITSLNSIGYNGRKFFGGLTFTLDATFARMASQLTETTGRGMINLFVGYRFEDTFLKKK